MIARERVTLSIGPVLFSLPRLAGEGRVMPLCQAKLGAAMAKKYSLDGATKVFNNMLNAS
jgi:hypothetical protein